MKITSEVDRQQLLERIDNAPIGTEVEITPPGMTKKQRGALHVWCEMMAKNLNEAGLDMVKVLSHKTEIPWSMITFKENVWKPTLKAMSDKDSTEDQNTVEPSDVYNVLARHFSQKMGLVVPPWPSRRG
jgi:hypothetical protein